MIHQNTFIVSTRELCLVMGYQMIMYSLNVLAISTWHSKATSYKEVDHI